jgi:hypothetical protein
MRPVKLLVACLTCLTAACGGAPFSTIIELKPIERDAGLDGHDAAFVEAGVEASADGGVDAPAPAPEAGSDAPLLDAASPEASTVEASIEAGVEASVEASIEASVDAADGDGYVCTPTQTRMAQASWSPGYPCGSESAQEVPGSFAWQGPAFSCGWLPTPAECQQCRESFTCDCLKAAGVCSANGQLWQGCTEDNNVPLVECK